jgi:hypothetical protein
VRPGRWAREIFSLLGFILPKESFTVGSVDGNSLKMKGCVLKVLCKSQTWTRL